MRLLPLTDDKLRIEAQRTGYTTRCAWCKRIKVKGVWMYATITTEHVSDGICQPCLGVMMKELEEVK